MRRLLLPLLVLGLMLVWVTPGQAQLWVGKRCDDVVKSSLDSVHVNPAIARPTVGNTVKVPIYMYNDSTVDGFRISVKFDTSKLALVPLPDQGTDTLNYEFRPAGRFMTLDTIFDDFNRIVRIDTVSNAECLLLQSQVTPYPRLRDVVQLLLLPPLDPTDSSADFDTIPRGSGVIAYIFFQLKSGVQDGDSIVFETYNIDNYIGDTVISGITYRKANGCYGTDLSELFRRINSQDPTDTVIYEQSIVPVTASNRQYLKLDATWVEPTNPTVDLTANPTSVSVGGGSTTLSWTATNADSVVITRSVGTPARVVGSTSLAGSTNVSLTATTTYTATAYRSSGTLTATDFVTVTVGTANNGTAPSFSQPTILTYTVNEGEPVGFTVSASDSDPEADRNIVTLSVSGMPSGASFPIPAAGTSVTSSFTWTPNIGQHGTFQVVFTATDNKSLSAQRVVTIIVNELEFDRLFSLSSPPPTGRPVGGLRGTTGIFFPINLVSAQDVYGIQFDVAYPDSIVRVDSVVKQMGRIPEYIIYDNIGVSPGSLRIVTFGMNNEKVLTDTNTAVMYLVVTLDSSATPWTAAPIKLRNGRESINPNPNVGSLPLVTDTTGIVEIDSLGDVNLDHYIDVADVVSIVANIIDSFSFTPRQFTAADMITDASVNVFDLVADINSIYGIPLPTPAPPLDEHAIVSLAYEDIPAGSSDVLTVASEIPANVAGAEMTIEYDPAAVDIGLIALTDNNSKFALKTRDDGYGRLKVLLYHPSPVFKPNELIQAGSAELLKVELIAKNEITSGNKQQLRLTEMLLSTPEAGKIEVDGVDSPNLPSSFWLGQNYPNPFNPNTIIEFSVAPAQGSPSTRDVSLEVYNVLGQKVRTLLNGQFPVGTHRVEWDATNGSGERVASGIYLYRLQVGAESQTRKMVFLK